MEMKKHEQAISEDRNQRLRLESAVNGIIEYINARVTIHKCISFKTLKVYLFCYDIILNVIECTERTFKGETFTLHCCFLTGAVNKLHDIEERIRRTEDSSKENKSALGKQMA